MWAQFTSVDFILLWGTYRKHLKLQNGLVTFKSEGLHSGAVYAANAVPEPFLKAIWLRS